MEKCLIIYNVKSSNWVKRSDSEISQIIGHSFWFVRMDIDEDYVQTIINHKVQNLVILGGDGTLNSVINKIKDFNLNIYYIPTGGLNEKAKAIKKFNPKMNLIVGNTQKHTFTYVAAAGSFTPIGYATKIKNKKFLKLIAYFFQAFKEYKVYCIPAKINMDGKNYDGDYTLIMFLKSPRCFIFRFNRKLYSPYSEYGQALLIKSCGKNNLINKIKIFFPMFRAFFMGFRKERQTKNITFVSFKNVDISVPKDTPFAFDGEKKYLEENDSIRMEAIGSNITVCIPNQFKVKRTKKVKK